jgi:hypothetical protein
MMIFYSDGGDPMLLDSAAGLRDLHAQIKGFVDSVTVNKSLAANPLGGPEPYAEFLLGLRMTKTDASHALSISADRWIEHSAPVLELRRFAEKFLMLNGEHRHWYSTPASLIIEANDWRASNS